MDDILKEDIGSTQPEAGVAVEKKGGAKSSKRSDQPRLPEELLLKIFHLSELKQRCRIQVVSRKWGAKLPYMCPTPSRDRARHSLSLSDALRDLASYLLPTESVSHAIMRLLTDVHQVPEDIEDIRAAVSLYAAKCAKKLMDAGIGNMHLPTGIFSKKKEELEQLIPQAKRWFRDLWRLLYSDDVTAIGEGCMMISIMTAGHEDQIQAVINGGLVFPPVHLLQTSKFDLKKECAMAISNATIRGNKGQIKYLVTLGCTKPLSDLLKHENNEIYKKAVSILQLEEFDEPSPSGGDFAHMCSILIEGKKWTRDQHIYLWAIKY